MKMINAGLQSPFTVKPGNYQFNCIRNKSCQREYLVPLLSLADIVLYVDLPGKPDTIEAALYDPCVLDELIDGGGGDFNDDFSDDFDNGNDSTVFVLHPCFAIFSKYVVGQKPDGSWYGVFSNVLIPSCQDPTPGFFFRLVFSINGKNYIYYTEQFVIEQCEALTFLRACYPNEKLGAEASDCNGIYYGFHSGPGAPLGDENYRYFHWAYVRKGSIIDKTAKLSFSIFNSRKTYKTTLSREKLLEFELVPAFYKTHLLGLFARGNVQINYVEYLLAEEQSWSVLDTDNKLWALDTLLAEECKNFFGCGPADCLLPIPPCAGSPATFSVKTTDAPSWEFVFSGGTFTNTDQIEWEVVEQATNVLIASGSITAPPLSFVIYASAFPDFTPETDCFLIRWRKKCLTGATSGWSEETYGLCQLNCQGLQSLHKPFVGVGWGPDTEAFDHLEYCDNNNSDVLCTDTKRMVEVGFFEDLAMTIPMNVTLVNYTINIGGFNYVLNGTGNCFAVTLQTYIAQDLDPNFCPAIVTVPQDINGPSLAECYSQGQGTNSVIPGGKIRIQRKAGTTLPSLYEMDCSLTEVVNGFSGPSHLDGATMGEEIPLGVIQSKVAFKFSNAPAPLIAGKMTISDGFHPNEVIDFSVTPLLVGQYYTSTGRFYMDAAHTILLEFEE